jgi:hypothetical protein
VIGSADTGVRDHYVDWTKLFAKMIRSFSDGFSITHISRRSHGFNTFGLRFTDNVIEQFFTAGEQTKVCTACGDLERDSLSDAGGRAGDHHHFIGPITHA